MNLHELKDGVYSLFKNDETPKHEYKKKGGVVTCYGYQ